METLELPRAELGLGHRGPTPTAPVQWAHYLTRTERCKRPLAGLVGEALAGLSGGVPPENSVRLDTAGLAAILAGAGPGVRGGVSSSSKEVLLGHDVAESAVAKYMVRGRKPPSQTWRTFLANHVGCLASIDFFTVHTVTFRMLYVLVVLRHDRRRVVHLNVTAHPTSEWTARQIVQAFPHDEAPRYLIRDRDNIYGEEVHRRIRNTGIEQVLIAPRSPWQSPSVERLIGSIRRECLDHVIVFNEDHLRRILDSCFGYYHDCRTHLSLDRNPPEPREVEPPSRGKVVAVPHVGGLHHRYTRAA